MVSRSEPTGDVYDSADLVMEPNEADVVDLEPADLEPADLEAVVDLEPGEPDVVEGDLVDSEQLPLD